MLLLKNNKTPLRLQISSARQQSTKGSFFAGQGVTPAAVTAVSGHYPRESRTHLPVFNLRVSTFHAASKLILA